MFLKKEDDTLNKALLTGNERPINSTKKPEIQSLRGIAILSVLLFHSCPKSFKQGFLGVDIFFVISGYLMCYILNKESSLTWQKVANFYFRRLKRIVPVYMFTISTVLIIAISFLLHPLDYQQIQRDIWKALVFCSNIPEVEDKGYFKQDQNTQKFFLHLWSLAVEIQFYILVPFLMIILSFCSIKLKYLIISLTIFVSFLYQLNSDGDREHMHLFSRIWQFIIGSLAFYIGQSKVLNFTTNNETFGNKILKHSIDTILSVLLVFSMYIEFLPHKQLNRLFVMTIILSIMSRQSKYRILCFWPLIELGNVSYSVYLIHWPIFKLYNYSMAYENITQTSTRVKIILIIASIITGYLMEKSWERLAKFIDSWKSLLICLAILYLTVFESIFYLQLNKWDEQILNSNVEQIENPRQVAKEAILIWKNKYNKKIDAQTAISYNLKFKQMVVYLSYCPNINRDAIPTNFNLSVIGFGNVFNNVVGITSSCVTTGNGTKNILMFGNSHSRAAHFGVEHYFKGTYKHFTMFSIGGCHLVPWKGHIAFTSKENYAGCLRFTEHMFEILENWKHQIDIIIMPHAYYYTPESELEPFLDKNTDKYYQHLQKMYSRLSKIAKDVVLFSRMQFNTGVIDQTRMIVKKILNRENLNVFKIPYEKEHSRAKNIRDRLDAIECPKCVPLNWEDIWCNKTLGTCDSVDHKNQLSYFFDFNHVNLLGSLKVGEYVYKQYNEWLIKN